VLEPLNGRQSPQLNSINDKNSSNKILQTSSKQTKDTTQFMSNTAFGWSTSGLPDINSTQQKHHNFENTIPRKPRRKNNRSTYASQLDQSSIVVE